MLLKTKTALVPGLLIMVIFCMNAFRALPQTDTIIYLTTDTIHVYYFHFTHRCQTCLSLEEEARTILKQVYTEYLSSGLITFRVYNIEKKSSRSAAEQAGVNTQALIILQKNKRFDLTRDGFLYILTNPDKFDKKFREVIDNLLYE